MKKASNVTNIQEEIWKDVVGYEGLYQVSSFGNVRGLERKISVERKSKTYIRTEKARIMKQSFNSNGYKRISLTRGKLSMVHRLVAMAFVPNNENKPHINHIDGNKINNHVSNLEWCTIKENKLHAMKLGLVSFQSGADHPRSKAIIDISTREEYCSLVDASKATGIGYANLSKMLTGKGKNKTSLRYA